MIGTMDPISRLSLLIDRGCPRKLSREVATIDKGSVRQTSTFEIAMGWSMLDFGCPRREVLLLAGQRGRGKSFAAAMILQCARIGSHSRWANARHISDWLHNAKYDGYAARKLCRMRKSELLVIDDLGWEHLDKSGYVLGSIVGMLDDRIQDEQRTVLTTNLDEKAFRARYGDAIHDRVRGYGTWVDVEPGPSMRGEDQ